MENITEILHGTMLDYSNLVRHSDDMYKIDRMKHRIDWIKDNCEGPNVLEIGCATGFILDYVNGTVGVDIDRERLKVAKTRRPDLDFYLVDAEKLDFQDKQFNTVLLPDVLEHMPFEKSKKVFNEACRISECVIFTVPMVFGEEDKNKNPEHHWLGCENTIKELIGNRVIYKRYESCDFCYIKLYSDELSDLINENINSKF
jgi:ubiquinone/menaquinone biosynthesis C-methylase UbiE